MSKQKPIQKFKFLSDKKWCFNYLRGWWVTQLLQKSLLNLFSQQEHCPKNSLNLCIKIKPVTVGVEPMVYVRFLGQVRINKSRTYTVESVLTVTGSVFMRRFSNSAGEYSVDAGVA